MKVKVPVDEHAFDEFMHEIDCELAASGHDIPVRPIRALGRVSDRFGISLSIPQPHPRADKIFVQNRSLSERILGWYKDQYGERLKVDHSLGRMVLKLDEDVWTLRFPLILGSAKFIVSTMKIRNDDHVSRNGPAHCNVVELIEGMTAARMRTLSDSQLENIFELFSLGIRAFAILEGTSENKLIWSARADIMATTTLLTSRPPPYGESKWASLQAAEKVMKAIIALQGVKFSHTHKLKTLAQELSQAGIQGEWAPFIKAIQCSPGIRYGEVSCSQDEAITAHHASLGLIVALADVSSGLRSNLAWGS